MENLNMYLQKSLHRPRWENPNGNNNKIGKNSEIYLTDHCELTRISVSMTQSFYSLIFLFQRT